MAGQDYPGSYAELLAWFPDDAACLDYLEWLRWPKGFRCPQCQGAAAWRLSSGRWQCSACGHQASVTAGTIFASGKLPLRLWFKAMYLLTQSKKGISSIELGRRLGVTQTTAWTLKHKLAQVMIERKGVLDKTTTPVSATANITPF